MDKIKLIESRVNNYHIESRGNNYQLYFFS